MGLELATLPLAAVAGGLSILSPCVWPLVPVVMASAATAGPGGPLLLTVGLALAFAFAGTLLSFALVSLGLDPELFRWLAGFVLIALGLVLVVPALATGVRNALSRLAIAPSPSAPSRTPWSQLGLGGLLGLVWLPCVGPTLGAAIGLASLGRDLPIAFATMLAYGLGTGVVLLAAGHASRQALARLRPKLLRRAETGRRALGVLLLGLGTLVLGGLDKRLEALVAPFVPELASSF